MKKMGKEGFSLVELIIAIAISTIVMMAVVALMGYGARTMNQTQARVALQDQAKDAMRHITSYVMEADSVVWTDANKALYTKRDIIKNDGAEEASKSGSSAAYYWEKDGSVYFAPVEEIAAKAGVDPGAVNVSMLTAEKTFVLADHVKEFKCEEFTDSFTDSTSKKRLRVKLELEDDVSSFSCEKDVYMRNQ